MGPSFFFGPLLTGPLVLCLFAASLSICCIYNVNLSLLCQSVASVADVADVTSYKAPGQPPLQKRAAN